MNKKKVLILNSNQLNNPKQLHLHINFEEPIENDGNKIRKFPVHKKKSKKNLNKTQNIINNNDLLLSSSSDDHTEYYKSFLKSLNESHYNENDAKYKSKTNEDKKKKYLRSNPLVKLKSSPNILNEKDKKKKLMYKKEKSQSNLNNEFKLDNSSLIKKDKEENLKKIKFTQFNSNNKPLTLSSNYEQNLDDKTIQTDFKGIKDKNKKKNLLNYSNSEYLEKSQSLVSSLFQNENLSPMNDISSKYNNLDINKKIKLNRRKVSANNFNEKKKNTHFKDNNIYESKVTYKKSNFLNVKKIDINNPRYKHSGKSLGYLCNSTNRKNDEIKTKEKQIETLSNNENLIKEINNKENNKIIIPNKKKKILFCCIPIN